MKLTALRIGFTLAACATLVVGTSTGCSSSESGGGDAGTAPPKMEAPGSLGNGEGQLNLIAWAGYAENGSNDPKVDWVTPFQQQTGCKANVKIAGTSDEMVTLMKTGDYDVVSASGDATLRLIYGGAVAPVNTDLVGNYKDIFEALKLKPWNSVDGVAYGIPHGRGANLLMYRTDVVKPVPDSWSAVFDPNSPYHGKVTAYDSPIYLADAALYLMKHKPDLGIKNPYALDDKQFAAAVDLLKSQNKIVGEYWSDYTKSVQAFKSGDTVLGTTWQVITNLAKADQAPVEAILPSEGSTGWSDTWMIAAKAKHPNCGYLWMNHIVSPETNAAVAEWFGEAPSNKLACDKTSDKTFCDTYHASDEAFFDKIWYWTTPVTQCLDGRTDVKCKDYAAWTQAWTTVKG